jgi:hypothetical protein
MGRSMRQAQSHLISDVLVLLHLLHAALKRGEVGRGEGRHRDADRDSRERKARDFNVCFVTGATIWTAWGGWACLATLGDYFAAGNKDVAVRLAPATGSLSVAGATIAFIIFLVTMATARVDLQWRTMLCKLDSTRTMRADQR